ncbi:hypothetical protein Vafri_14918 [Volvox africanus]|uniref:Uncharacterized protein n=1 Tax=Volvox africanus TaxID=51714 RepID=A0A8J4F438_9CHLO|nr:hypothetical protein Vafri_14918 [Volvox africanus]
MQARRTSSCRALLGVTRPSTLLLPVPFSLPLLPLHLFLLLLLVVSLATFSHEACAAVTPGTHPSVAPASSSRAIHSLNRRASALPPKRANLTACPNLRIAIFNGVPYHYEVLAGLAHLFRRYRHRTDVYVHRYTQRDAGEGSWDVLRRFRIKYRLLTRTRLEALARDKPFYDVVILVSPEYELPDLENLLQNIRRHLTVAIVHNSDFEDMQHLIRVAEGGGSSMRLVTLSPHTAASLAARVGRNVEWALPVYPFKPDVDCLNTSSTMYSLQTCLRGFSIQVRLWGPRG